MLYEKIQLNNKIPPNIKMFVLDKHKTKKITILEKFDKSIFFFVHLKNGTKNILDFFITPHVIMLSVPVRKQHKDYEREHF